MKTKKRQERRKPYLMSADNTMRVISGTYDPIPFDEKQSVLPKWLLDRGLMNYHDFLQSRPELRNKLREAERSKQRKNSCKCERRSVRYDIRSARDDLRKFSIEYFEVKDVEKAFRELLEKGGGGSGGNVRIFDVGPS